MTERLDAALPKVGAIASLGALAPLLDTTIVNVAVPGLSRDLNASVTTVQWVATGYLLTLAMVVPLVGRLVGERWRTTSTEAPPGIST